MSSYKERLRRAVAGLCVDAIKINCTTLKQALTVLAKQQWPVVTRKPWAITFKYGTECYEVVTICTGHDDSRQCNRRQLIDWHQPFYIHF
jgi:hypothetical protein